MALTLAVGLAGPAVSVSVAVKEEKQIADPDGKLRVTGRDGLLYTDKGDEGKILCDEDGHEITDLVFVSAENMVNDVWQLNRQGEEVPESCVVKTDGTVLIPWCLCVIKARGDSFLDVITGEEKTENKDEAIMYVSPNMFTIGIPGDEDVLYKGRDRLYDLTNEKMLEDVVLTTANQSFDVVGSSYKVNDGINTPVIMDASGKVLAEDASRIYAESNEYYYGYQDGKLMVYDDKMTLLTENEQAKGILKGGYLYTTDENDKYGLLSLDGKELIAPMFENMPRVLSGGLVEFHGKNASDDYVYGLTDLSGNIVLESKYYMIGDLDDGYLYAKETSDSETTIFLAPDGKVIADKLEGYPDSSLCEEIEKGKYLILNSGTTLDLPENAQASTVGTAMIKVWDAEKKTYAVYELYNGEQLLDYEWEDVFTAYGKIYAYKDGAWHVFSLS